MHIMQVAPTMNLLRLALTGILRPTLFQTKDHEANKRFLEVYFKVLLQGVNSNIRQRQAKTKEAPQCYRLNTSQSWEVTWVSIGLLQVNVGKGACEQEGRGNHGRFWIPKWWIRDVYSTTWGRKDVCKGAKGICSQPIQQALVVALTKGVPRLSIHMAHTHTHTQENMLAM